MPTINNPFASAPSSSFSDLDPEEVSPPVAPPLFPPLDAVTLRRVTRRRDYALAVLRSAGVQVPTFDDPNTIQEEIDLFRHHLKRSPSASTDAVRLARMLLLDAARLARGAADATPVDD